MRNGVGRFSIEAERSSYRAAGDLCDSLRAKRKRHTVLLVVGVDFRTLPGGSDQLPKTGGLENR